MPRSVIGRLGAVLIGCSLLVVPATARAETGIVEQPEYEAAYAASADASPAFAVGATVTFTTEGADDGDKDVTVNANGSLIGTWQRDGALVNIRCVRINRCWEKSLGGYHDRKWHLLPKGSVTYQLARDFWSAWMGFPWAPGSIFAIDTLPNGAPFYAVGNMVGDTVVVNGSSFYGSEARNQVVSLAQEGEPTILREGSLIAANPVSVTPPGKRTVGAPALPLVGASRWIVPINQLQ